MENMDNQEREAQQLRQAITEVLHRISSVEVLRRVYKILLRSIQ